MLLVLIPKAGLAKNHWQMITFGRHGLGWSGSAERMQTKSPSEFKSVTNIISDLSLNYAYRISRRFQLGAFYEQLSNEYKFKRKGAGTSSQSLETNTLGMFIIYNFHHDLKQAYYLGLSASNSFHEEEVSHDFTDVEGKAPIELDDTNQTYELFFGKRLPISIMGFDNLSFSPQVRLFYQTHGKDFDDQDVDYGLGVSLQPVRFDLLF
jgi:hypothetical protein